MSDFEWLKDESNKPKSVVAKIKADPHYRELEDAFNAIKGPSGPRKKLYLLCYLQAGYDPRAAANLYEQRLGKGERPKVAQWRKDESFQTAIELAEGAVYRSLGISTASVLAMIRDELDKARASNDPQAAARFLEMLGKHLKLWQNTDDRSNREGPALNINIIAPPSEPEIKDITDRSVTIDLPKPEDQD
jgi:hypothetical protein